jgi:hypothetical protein
MRAVLAMTLKRVKIMVLACSVMSFNPTLCLAYYVHFSSVLVILSVTITSANRDSAMSWLISEKGAFLAKKLWKVIYGVESSLINQDKCRGRMGIVVVCSTNITKYVELIPVYHNMTTHL